MKRIFFLLAAFVLTNPALAQIDIRSLSGKDFQTLVKQFGTPVEEDHGTNYMCADVLLYNHFTIYLDKVYKNGKEQRSLGAFVTDSDRFCFLSDVYPGGLKVGTKLSDLQRFDFVNCKYGKGLAANGLRKASANEIQYKVFKTTANYFLFKANYRYYYFTVEDGKIVEWAMTTKADAAPDPNAASSGGK